MPTLTDHAVGDLSGSADEDMALADRAAAGNFDEIARRRVLLAAALDHPIAKAVPGQSGQFVIGERCIIIALRKVVVQHFAQQSEAVDRLEQAKFTQGEVRARVALEAAAKRLRSIMDKRGKRHVR